MRDSKIIFLFIALILVSPKIFGQKLTPEMLGMAREDIRFTDNQLRLLMVEAAFMLSRIV